jgi:hypothetical protein
MALNPLVYLWKPLATFPDKVLLGEVNHVYDGLGGDYETKRNCDQ